jgi:hypothetical protein
LKSIIADLFIVAGACAIPAGIYEIYKPAGYIAMGIMLLAIGALLHYSNAKNSKQ